MSRKLLGCLLAGVLSIQVAADTTSPQSTSLPKWRLPEVWVHNYVLVCTGTVSKPTTNHVWVGGVGAASRTVTAPIDLAGGYTRATIQFASDSYTAISGAISNASFQVYGSTIADATRDQMLPLQLRPISYASGDPLAWATTTITVNLVNRWGVFGADVRGLRRLQIQMSNATMPINATAYVSMVLQLRE